MGLLTNVVVLSGFTASEVPKISYSDSGYATIGFNIGHKEYRKVKQADGTMANADPLWMWVRITSRLAAEGKQPSLAERIIAAYRKNMRLCVTGKLQSYIKTNGEQGIQLDATDVQELDMPAQHAAPPAPPQPVQPHLPPVQYQQPVAAPAPVAPVAMPVPPSDDIPF